MSNNHSIKNLENNKINLNPHNSKNMNKKNNNELGKGQKGHKSSNKSNLNPKRYNKGEFNNKKIITDIKKKNNIAKIKFSERIRKINSRRYNTIHNRNKSAKPRIDKLKRINEQKKKKPKDDFDIEYEKLNNLCYNKKRSIKEIQNYITEQKLLYEENEIKQQILREKINNKIYTNFKNLAKSIKNIRHQLQKIKKDKRKDEIGKDEEESKIEENSNGSIGDFIEDNNKPQKDKKDKNNNAKVEEINKILEKKYYFGCLDVKCILSNRNINISKIKLEEDKKI